MTVEQVIAALNTGGLAILPTETVYGIAARADLPDAIALLRQAKGDRGSKPFPVQVPFGFPLRTLAELPPAAEEAIGSVWPGPLTIVVRLLVPLPGLADTIALRCPDHPLTQAVLRATGPLAVPSANRSGEPAPATYPHAVEALAPLVFPGLNGGAGSGRPSRIVRYIDGIVVLRP